jgi:uncharacterized NAD-dependent epimerase/dehydratase family protein
MIHLYETMAGILQPSRVIGIAMNSRGLSDRQAEQERRHVADQLGLPVCDVIRHGPDELVGAVLRLRSTQ